eukprot:TRINITY_DN931_c0_g1_i1.p1 TRINITY_DN931_c0_g1~~TRINITY_DN931_c0_g1_i1.p1  ORF type:complete len:389 (+),score=57.76 TRINITY_DN931_c0_g1_i1:303-1469(+)
MPCCLATSHRDWIRSRPISTLATSTPRAGAESTHNSKREHTGSDYTNSHHNSNATTHNRTFYATNKRGQAATNSSSSSNNVSNSNTISTFSSSSGFNSSRFLWRKSTRGRSRFDINALRLTPGQRTHTHDLFDAARHNIPPTPFLADVPLICVASLLLSCSAHVYREWTREFARYEAPALGSQFNRYEQVYAQQSRQRLEWQDEFADYVPDVDRDFGDLERAYEEVAQPKSAAETAEEWAREFEESGERLEEETWFANFISEGEASVGQQTPTPRVVRTRPQYGRMTPTQTSSSMTTSSSATNSGVQDSEELRRLAGEIENIGDPKLQNSRFMTFIRDINRGDVDLSAGDNGGSGGDADGAGNRRAGGDNGSGGRRTQTPHSLPGDTT